MNEVDLTNILLKTLNTLIVLAAPIRIPDRGAIDTRGTVPDRGVAACPLPDPSLVAHS